MSDNESEEQKNTNSGAAPTVAPSLAELLVGEASLDSQLSAAARKQKDPEAVALNKKYMMIGAGVVALLLLILSVYSCQPKKGSMAYGVCSTLLEMNSQYPNTLRHINVEGSRTTVRIYFTSVDAFGQFKLEMFECKFGQDTNSGMRLTDVVRNRNSLGREFVDMANRILPVIVKSDPYRIMPPEWENPVIRD